MICHDLKCIFVHIPRCAGTSIETWLTGTDWWRVDPATKHLTARQAGRLYAAQWPDYFKFAVVRDPVARCRSMLKYAAHFGLAERQDGGIDFSGYHARFGDPVVVEYDHRFHDPASVRHPDHASGRVYGNILDLPLDFVARYETLDRDMERVRQQLGLTRRFDVHTERSSRPASPLPERTQSHIHTLYAGDILEYGY